jgi:hypothetical protein
MSSASRYSKYEDDLRSKVDVVVDVGASDGSWWTRHKGFFKPGVTLLSIEPLDIYMGHPSGILERCLVGASCGDGNIFVADDLYSSSVSLDSKAIEVLSMPTHTLECLLEKHGIDRTQGLFIKTDVQGGDVTALLSAGSYLGSLVAGQCELQMYPYNSDMCGFVDSAIKLGEANLAILEFMDPLDRPFDNRLGQIDVLLAPVEGELFSSPVWA